MTEKVIHVQHALDCPASGPDSGYVHISARDLDALMAERDDAVRAYAAAVGGRQIWEGAAKRAETVVEKAASWAKWFASGEAEPSPPVSEAEAELWAAVKAHQAAVAAKDHSVD